MSDDQRPPESAEDIDSLGAAPTRMVGGSVKAQSTRVRRKLGLRGSGSGSRSKVRNMVVVMVLVIGLAFAPAVFSSLKKTPSNMVGISYGGGPFEAARFQRVVPPSSRLFFNGLFDSFYLYPADTQTYIVSKSPTQGAVRGVDSISSPSRDRVKIDYQIAVYFKLNIDRLQAFHEQLGLQFQAYTPAGWNRLIQDTFRQQIENTLQENTRRFDVSQIYGNAADLVGLQTDVEKQLSQRLTGALGQAFFCGPVYGLGKVCTPPTFIIKAVDIPDDVAAAYQENETSLIKVKTNENEIAQREAQSKSILALNQGLSQAGMNYVLLRGVESGKINFWVLPSDSGVTLQAPDSSGKTPITGGK